MGFRFGLLGAARDLDLSPTSFASADGWSPVLDVSEPCCAGKVIYHTQSICFIFHKVVQQCNKCVVMFLSTIGGEFSWESCQ